MREVIHLGGRIGSLTVFPSKADCPERPKAVEAAAEKLYHPAMCNTYTVRPKLSAIAHEREVNEAVAKLKTSLVRRSAPGVVMLATDGALHPELMLLGFHRPFSDSINNARSDRFTSPM